MEQMCLPPYQANILDFIFIHADTQKLAFQAVIVYRYKNLIAIWNPNLTLKNVYTAWPNKICKNLIFCLAAFGFDYGVHSCGIVSSILCEDTTAEI